MDQEDFEDLAARLESKLELEPERFRLTASGFGTYFQLGCDLHLRRKADVGKSKSQAAVPAGRAVASGPGWEEAITQHLQGTGAVVRDCTGQGGLQVLEELARGGDTGVVYLTQSLFRVPPAALPQPLRVLGARVGTLIPDFLKLQRDDVTQPWTLSVIDAKATTAIKSSHQAQVREKGGDGGSRAVRAPSHDSGHQVAF
jgi:hypothetical protein